MAGRGFVAANSTTSSVTNTPFLTTCFVRRHCLFLAAASVAMHDEGNGGIDKETLMVIALGCCGGLLIFYVLFLLFIERDYVHTFFDTRTGSTYAIEQFTKSESDEQKINIFTTHEGKWRGEVGDLVKEWLAIKLPLWLEEQPPWFCHGIKATIPDWAVEDKAFLAKIRTEEVLAIRRTPVISVRKNI